MKLIHYNILDGCEGDEGRKDAIGRWLKEQGAEIVTLNELNGWHHNDGLSEFGQRWGWAHSAIAKVAHSDYPVGILSSLPMDDIVVIGRPFHHSMLQTRVAGVRVWVTHLTPVDAQQRKLECQWIAEQARSIKDPLIIAGDLNTLSPLDADEHERSGIQTLLQASLKLKRKFLTDEGDIDYEPMQILLDAGLHDLRAPQPVQASVPTPFNCDAAHAAPMRLDYLLANSAFRQLQPVASIEKIEAVSLLSDHYPVIAQWQ